MNRILISHFDCSIENDKDKTDLFSILKEKKELYSNQTQINYKYYKNFINDEIFEQMNEQKKRFIELFCKCHENILSTNTGVYISADTYFKPREVGVIDNVDYLKNRLNNDINFIGTYLSYLFDLTGESIGIQSACSSSMSAVIQAIRALKTADIECAIVVGGSVNEKSTYKIKKGMIHSPTGVCKPYDYEANGTVETTGVGILFLTTEKFCIENNIEFSNFIEIIDYNSNNDGNKKKSFSSTSKEGLKSLVQPLIENQVIDFYELHGTGTVLGDAIELGVFEELCTQESTIGSIKSNIGHTIHGSGIMSIIKSCISLIEQCQFPNANFEAFHLFNRNIEKVKVCTEFKYREINKILVTSMGMGGTNGALLLGERASE